MKGKFKLISNLLVVTFLAVSLPTRVVAKAADPSTLMEGDTQQNVSQLKLEDQQVAALELENAQKESKIVGEVNEKRDESTKYFMKEDHSYEAAVYPIPVHYFEDGKWKEIDNTLEETSDDTFKADGVSSEASTENARKSNVQATVNKIKDTDKNTLKTKQNSFKISFAKDTNSKKLIKVQKDKYELSWGIDTSKKSNSEIIKVDETKLKADIKKESEEKVEKDKKYEKLSKAEKSKVKEVINENENKKVNTKASSSVEYKQVLENIDLRYDLLGNSLKENIIIDKPVENLKLDFKLNFKNLIPEVKKDKSIVFYDDKDKTKAIFSIQVPYMYDASGAESKDIDVKLNQSENQYILTIQPNGEWLNNKDRKYPVTIDPPISSSIAQADIKETFVCSNDTSDKSNNQYLRMGNTPGVGYTRSYMKFVNLPKLTTGDMITNANMYLLKEPTVSGTFSQINVHKVTSAWEAPNIRWNSQPSYDPKIVDYGVLNNDQWYKWDITSIAKEWYTTGTNNGVMLKYNDENAGHTAFWSSDVSDTYVNLRPRIIFDYVNNSGLEDYWTYHSQDIGRAGTGYVNDYNGNLVHVHSDVATTGSKMPISVNHVFNSNNKDQNIGYGLGWRLNYGQKVSYYQKIENVDYYRYEDEDGTVHYFKYDSASATFKDESGMNLTLTKNGDGTFTIKDKKDNLLNFNTSGLLVNVKDSNGNMLSIAYDGTKIKSITDGAGRVVMLQYNSSGNLSQIVDSASRITTYAYNGSSLTSITYPDAKTSSFAYDSLQRMTDTTSIDGYKIKYGYYDMAPYRIKSILETHNDGTLGEQQTIEYSRNITYFTDSKGRRTTYQFNNYGNTTGVTASDGSAKYYDYIDNINDSNKNKTKSESKLQKTNTNLLLNHNFEDSNNWNPGTWNGNVSSKGYVTEDKYLGNQSLKINSTTEAGGTDYEQALTVEKGKRYTLSAYVKTVGIPVKNDAGASFFVGYTDANGICQFIRKYINGTNDWQRYSFDFTIPVDARDGIWISLSMLNSTGTVYYDCVQLEEGSVANRYNLVENSNLIYGGDMPTYWKANSQLDSNDKPVTTEGAPYPSGIGNRSFKIVGNADKQKALYQFINQPGKKGDSLVLGGWLKGASVATGSGKSFALSVGFQLYDDTYEWYGIDMLGEVNDWQYIAKKLVATNDYKRLLFYVIYYKNANTAYFDGLQLYKEQFGTSFQYDSKGNVVSTATLANQNSKFDYDGSNNLMTSTDPKGSQFKYEYDTKHNITKATTAENVVYSFTYDSNGNPKTAKVGDSTIFTQSEAGYTASGNYINSLKDASGNTVTYNYNETKGTLDSVTDAKKTTTSYTYDSNVDRLQSVSKTVDGTMIKNSYDYDNDKIKAITHNGFSYNFGYDSLGNNTTVAVGSQNLITNKYESRTGKLLQSNYGNGNGTALVYDNADRLVSKSTSITNSVGVNYDGQVENIGWQPWVSDGAISGTVGQGLRLEALKVQLTSPVQGMRIKYQAYVQNIGWQDWVYDGNIAGTAGQSLRIEAMKIQLEGAPAGYSVTYQVQVQDIGWMDPVKDGALAGTTGQNKRVESIKISIKVPKVQEYKYEYDANSNLAYKEDSVNNKSFKYTYDLSDRLTQVSDNSQNTVRYDYDLNNNISKVLSQYYGSSYLTSYEYDKDNRETKTITSNGNSISKAYDSLGRITNRTINPTLYNTSYAYKAGQNGATTSQVESINNNGNQISYTYDANGNIETITEGSNVTKYYYNELNEVIREDNKGAGKTLTYSYDAGGNITSKIEYSYTTGALGGSTSTINYGYGDANWKDKLTSYNGKSITYDQIGNPLSYDGYTYNWQAGRQLSSISGNSKNLSFRYNDDGIRTQKTYNGVTTNYDLQGDKVVYESNGTDKLYYTYDSSDNLVSMNLNGVEYFYIRNAQGDIIGLIDKTGTQVVSYTYDTWGKVISIDGSLKDSVGVKNPYRYRGYRYDSETGLYYLQSRYYNPEWGRFVNADTITGSTGELLTSNMFAYCRNNPVNMVDDDGYWPKWATKVLIGVGAIAIVTAITVATGGAGAPVAIGLLQTALGGAAGGAVFGGAIGLATGGVKGAINGAIDGAATGFMYSAVIGGVFAAGAKVAKAAEKWNIVKYAKDSLKFRFQGKTMTAYMDKNGYWWSKDLGGHGGSAYKVYRKVGKTLQWVHDADINGNFIEGKFKGEVGKIIKLN
ncbi:DNRLRE domain-containing protein [Clostridium sp. C8-1-8]|uniref:DNRLRE domain-containing protein n=1 Tax=Clostridium sp. C8-1-8 TaxID=2698831 RepID=UPI00136B018A|nr:DNRLRE domain-containing protein [Clostridium sp. C8-1-8]